MIKIHGIIYIAKKGKEREMRMKRNEQRKEKECKGSYGMQWNGYKHSKEYEEACKKKKIVEKVFFCMDTSLHALMTFKAVV